MGKRREFENHVANSSRSHVCRSRPLRPNRHRCAVSGRQWVPLQTPVKQPERRALLLPDRVGILSVFHEGWNTLGAGSPHLEDTEAEEVLTRPQLIEAIGLPSV